jgi:hypothetical protein
LGPTFPPTQVRTSSVFGLEVVLLASPFSTARAAEVVAAVVAEHDVFVETVVLSEADLRDPLTA